jgi:hypothetical protein
MAQLCQTYLGGAFETRWLRHAFAQAKKLTCGFDRRARRGKCRPVGGARHSGSTAEVQWAWQQVFAYDADHRYSKSKKS